jgi:hypothetical protein
VDFPQRVISLAVILCSPTVGCKNYNHQIHF